MQPSKFEACTRFRRKGVPLWGMDTKKLHTPVVIFSDRPGGFYLISTVADASDFLFDNWAENDSEQWTDAMNQCAGADMGMTSVEDANVAFVTALKAAGLRIDPTISLL